MASINIDPTKPVYVPDDARFDSDVPRKLIHCKGQLFAAAEGNILCGRQGNLEIQVGPDTLTYGRHEVGSTPEECAEKTLRPKGVVSSVLSRIKDFVPV